eukprot:gnl/TRDRNA2_/TRDRNA2_136540_c0_seq1.p1 gnl/TRDRNA2_/TRDRNA2_136540_c0~~gnl/TRDRNA2_/TRDRNA2_136540_c0_seq1.p1  ORF type:complete len:352 (-),score=55.04 gnl/TRDRNA2_/TRDRNA2_136540_c0_seq1:121-1128(-)
MKVSASGAPTGQERRAMAMAPVVLCRYSVFPMACHDKVHIDENDELVVQLCHYSEVMNLAPQTRCRLTPEPLPFLPPASVAVQRPPVNVELVTWACCATDDCLESAAAAWEDRWLDRHQAEPHFVLSIVIYHVCYPGHDHDSDTKRSPPAYAIMEHLLAHIHAARKGQEHQRNAPDAFIVVGDIWKEHWVSHWGWRPNHYINVFDEMLRQLNPLPAPLKPLEDEGYNNTYGASPLGRWLFVFDSPPGPHHVCQMYFNMMSTHCPVPRSIEGVVPQVFAFSANILEDAPFAEWETLATHRDGTGVRAWQPSFNMLFAMVAKQVTEHEVVVVGFPRE